MEKQVMLHETALVKPVITFLLRLCNSITLFVPKLWNLATRPKLLIEFKISQFEFVKLGDAKKRVILIPHIAITNPKKQKIKIKPNSIYFNTTPYTQLHNPEILSVLDKAKIEAAKIQGIEFMHSYFKNNWLEITQGRADISIKTDEIKIFPIILLKAAINHLSAKKQNSKLFFSNQKISIALNINGKNYEYGFNRNYLHETYLNYMASYTSQYPADYKIS